MPDRIEREIEEILAKIDEMPGDGERKPISILDRKKKQVKPPRAPRQGPSIVDRLSPPVFLFLGAGTMVAGLILASFAGPFIWLSFAGVVMFIGAFLLSFFRRPRPVSGGAAQPRGHYWRDRYIEYQPASAGPFQRLKRRLRKR